MPGAGNEGEVVRAPALAEIQGRIMARAYWLCGEPLMVNPQLWREARHEHAQILADRGWPLAQNNELAGHGIEHFLLCGVPIVKANA